MLMMSRRQGETILIGDDVEIVITHIGRSRVKVGISAPRHMTVVAKEIRMVGEENRAAAGAPPALLLNALLAQLQPAVHTFSLRSDENSVRQDAGTRKLKGIQNALHSNQRKLPRRAGEPECQ